MSPSNIDVVASARPWRPHPRRRQGGGSGADQDRDDRAAQRTVRADRQGHGDGDRALPRRGGPAGGGAQDRATRRGRRGEPRGRGDQGEEARRGRQGTPRHGRAAGVDRVRDPAVRGRAEDPHDLPGDGRRRHDPAQASQVGGADRVLVEPVASSVRRVGGHAAQVQAGRGGRGGLRVRLGEPRRLPEDVRGRGRPDRPEALGAAEHDRLRSVHHPESSSTRRRGSRRGSR